MAVIITLKVSIRTTPELKQFMCIRAKKHAADVCNEILYKKDVLFTNYIVQKQFDFAYNIAKTR